MSERFKVIEQKYCELWEKLSRSVDVLEGEHQEPKQVFEFFVGLRHARLLIRKMEMEAIYLKPNAKAMVRAKAQEYRIDLNNLESELGMNDPTKKSYLRKRFLMAAERLKPLEIRDIGGSCFKDLDRRLSLVPANKKESVLMSTERIITLLLELGCSMSQLFEVIEQQYSKILEKLSRSDDVLEGEQKEQKISEMKEGLNEARYLISKLHWVADISEPNLKAKILAKSQECETDLDNLESELRMDDTMMVSADCRFILESEELGVSSPQDLHQSHQSLPRTNNTGLVSANQRERDSMAKESSNRLGLELRGTVSQQFEVFDEQYCKLWGKLSRLADVLKGEQEEQIVSEIKIELHHAWYMIFEMHLVASSSEPKVRTILMARLQEYETDLNNLESELKSDDAMMEL